MKALSRLFRATFQRELRRDTLAAEIADDVWHEPWVVHSQGVGTGELALRYLAPYVFRVALSNRRWVKLEDGQVTFRYVEAKTGQTRFCTLPAEAFLRRFLQHVLPKGFVNVRYDGLFALRSRQALLALQQRLAEGDDDSAPLPNTTNPSPAEPERCPSCGCAMQVRPLLRVRELLRARARCPPNEAVFTP